MRVLLISALVLSLFACRGTEQPVSDSEDIPVEPETPVLRVTAEIGLELGDSNFVFGVIQDVDFTADGNIAVLDMQKKKISIFSTPGEFLGEFGGAGEGPGEFLNPQGIACLSDGRIAVTDPFSRKVEIFGSNLQHLETFSDFVSRAPFVITAVGTGFAGEQGDFNRDAGTATTSVALWEEDADSIIVFFEIENNLSPDYILNRIMKPRAGLISDNGNVYYSAPESKEYSVSVYPIDGSERYVLSRPGYVPVVKSAEDLQEDIDAYEYRMQAMASSGRGRRLAGITYDPPADYYAISSIGADSEGNIWVQRGWESNPTFDLFPPGATESVETVFADPDLELSDFTFVISPHGMAAFNPNPDDYPRVLILSL